VIPALILAAGKSTRMGTAKALLPLGPSDTFLTRIIRTFQQAGVDDVVVVLGHEADAIEASVVARGLSCRFVRNAEYERGQLSSLLAGLRAVDRPGTAAVLLTLVDVPLVAASTVRAVLDRYRQTRAPVVRAIHGALHGHPVLIDRALFDELLTAPPEAGAKPVIRAHVSTAGDVEVSDEGAFLDVDTPEEYARALARLVEKSAGAGSV
jgi:molybdenum cofactor cytidylyltransferase